MRCLTPVEGKKAVIIDYVNNVQRHGMPTADREWSLDKPIKEYYNENDDGTFKIRVCQNCFMTFETADTCPYCGAVYETTPIEIENFKQIELKKIEEAKEEKRQRYLKSIKEKVKDYKSAKECANWVELVKWCEHKRYKPGYAFILAKQMRHTISEKEENDMFVLFMCLIVLITITIPICYHLYLIKKELERIIGKTNNLIKKGSGNIYGNRY